MNSSNVVYLTREIQSDPINVLSNVFEVRFPKDNNSNLVNTISIKHITSCTVFDKVVLKLEGYNEITVSLSALYSALENLVISPIPNTFRALFYIGDKVSWKAIGGTDTYGIIKGIRLCDNKAMVYHEEYFNKFNEHLFIDFNKLALVRSGI